jgi:hypothetical protein
MNSPTNYVIIVVYKPTHTSAYQKEHNNVKCMNVTVDGVWIAYWIY